MLWRGGCWEGAWIGIANGQMHARQGLVLFSLTLHTKGVVLLLRHSSLVCPESERFTQQQLHNSREL